MKIYLVGGAVRDKLLGIKITDKDFVVVGSNKEEMLNLGYRQVGKDFPVFLHPITGDEYALARVERKTGSGYTGFECKTKNVSLKDDLSRRDLTINSMAIDENNNLIDYFGGEEDLQLGLLKHTSSAFSEDPVRILRVARFAAKFKNFGFKVAHSTHKLMMYMVENKEVDNLISERVFAELQKTLSYKTPSAFFKVLANCSAYHKVFGVGAEQRAKQNTHQNNWTYLDNLDTDEIVKFALWVNNYSPEKAKIIIKKLKAPKIYEKVSILNITYKKLAKNILNEKPVDILNFFIKTNSLRDKKIFNYILQVFAILEINTEDISNIFNAIIQVKFDNNSNNGVEKLQQQRLTAIKKYVG